MSATVAAEYTCDRPGCLESTSVALDNSGYLRPALIESGWAVFAHAGAMVHFCPTHNPWTAATPAETTTPPLRAVLSRHSN